MRPHETDKRSPQENPKTILQIIIFFIKILAKMNDTSPQYRCV